MPLPSPHYLEFQQKLPGLDTPMQRSAVFSATIQMVDSETAAPLFAEICRRPGMARAPLDILLAEAAFLSLITGSWPQAHLQHTREAAAYAEEEVTLLFLNQPDSMDAKEESFQIPKYTNDRVLTLGERKSLAAMPSRQTLEKAMMDPHPDVARKLLANPKLTEADVVRICAKSTMAPSVLCEIAGHPRWRRQKTVQKSLVHNRLLPADYAVTLIPFLERRVMKDVAQDARLDARVQMAAKVLLDSILEALHN